MDPALLPRQLVRCAFHQFSLLKQFTGLDLRSLSQPTIESTSLREILQLPENSFTGLETTHTNTRITSWCVESSQAAPREAFWAFYDGNREDLGNKC